MRPNPNHRGDPVFISELFKQFGVPLDILPGAMNWGMGDFNAIQGVIWHHTGARNTSAQYIARNPGLSNALSSQFHVDPTGKHTLCGIGIAWHAGRGSYPGWPTDDANRVSIGFEIQGNGTDPWPEKQLDMVARATACILWYLGKRATTNTMISHWEYSLKAQGKWDPGAGNGRSGAMLDMNPWRERVNRYIDTINTHGALDAPKGGLTMDAVKYLTDFIKGYLSPVISDVKDIRQQLTGGRDAGDYSGWPQLGKDIKGRNLTLVDAVAALRSDVATLSSKVDQLTKAGER